MFHALNFPHSWGVYGNDTETLPSTAQRDEERRGLGVHLIMSWVEAGTQSERCILYHALGSPQHSHTQATLPFSKHCSICTQA